jgi:UDP-glucose 4-epimerase
MNDDQQKALRSLSGRPVLVTGGRGFIGGVLSRRLAAAGAEVFTVGRTPPQVADEGTGLTANLESIEETRAVFERARPECVFHLASHVVGARSPELVLPTFHGNLTSTVNVLVAAREAGCARVMLTGSLEEPEPSGEWSVPSSPYAAAKLAAGSYGRMFNALFDLPVVILRVFMVYGPAQRDIRKLIPYVITTLNAGGRPTFTSGARLVDWIYVDDVADAFVHAATAPGIEGATLDVGSGELVSVRSVVEQLYEILQVPEAPEFGHVSDRPMEQVRRADVSASQQALGWRPNVSLAEGLRRTADWYTRHEPAVSRGRSGILG